MTAPAQDKTPRQPTLEELQDAIAVFEREAENERTRARIAEAAHASDMRSWAAREAWYEEEVAKRDLRIAELEGTADRVTEEFGLADKGQG